MVLEIEKSQTKETVAGSDEGHSMIPRWHPPAVSSQEKEYCVSSQDGDEGKEEGKNQVIPSSPLTRWLIPS